MSDPDVFLAHDDAVQVPIFFSVSLFFCFVRSINKVGHDTDEITS